PPDDGGGTPRARRGTRRTRAVPPSRPAGEASQVHGLRRRRRRRPRVLRVPLRAVGGPARRALPRGRRRPRRGRRVRGRGRDAAGRPAADGCGPCPVRAVPRLPPVPRHRRGAPAALRGGGGRLLPLPTVRHRLRRRRAVGAALRRARGAGGRAGPPRLVHRRGLLRPGHAGLHRPRPLGLRVRDDGEHHAVRHTGLLGRLRLVRRRWLLRRGWGWWRRRRPLSRYRTGTSVTRTSGVRYPPSRPATSSTTDIPGTRGQTTVAT